MQRFLGSWLVCVFLFLAACSGGGGHSSTAANSGSGGSNNSAAATSYDISGVAATGSPIVGRIYIKDAAGHEQFVDTTDGTFQFSLTNFTAPFLLKAEWVINGQTLTLFSFSPDSGVANITPLTHMAMVAATGTVDLSTLYTNNSADMNMLKVALPLVTAEIQQSIAPLLAKYNVSDTDIFTTPFVPDHSGFDALLDSIDVNFNPQTVVVSDKNSGAIIFDAPTNQITHAFIISDWVNADANVANDPDVAIDSSGRTLVVWSENINSHYVIRARFLEDGGASSSTISNAGDATLPRVAIDAADNAMVVWAQYQNNLNAIWASRFDKATKTWSTPFRVSNNSVADAYVPDVGVDAIGNAIVTWYEGDGRVNHFDVWCARFAVAQNSWSTPQLISDGVNSAYLAHVAMNASGAGLVAWEQEQGDGTTVSNAPKDIYGRTITSAGVKGASTQLNAVAGNVDWIYGQVAVGIDANGNGGAVWVQDNGAIHAAMFLANAGISINAGWQTSQAIASNPPATAYSPRIGFDSNGNAIAVWQQQTGSSAYGASNRYVANSGWGNAVQFVDDSNGDVYDPRIAVDAAGNATAVWYQWASTPTNSVTVNTARYTLGNGWGAVHLLANTDTNGYTNYPVPRVATNAAGKTTAIWGVDFN